MWCGPSLSLSRVQAQGQSFKDCCSHDSSRDSHGTLWLTCCSARTNSSSWCWRCCQGCLGEDLQRCPAAAGTAPQPCNAPGVSTVLPDWQQQQCMMQRHVLSQPCSLSLPHYNLELPFPAAAFSILAGLRGELAAGAAGPVAAADSRGRIGIFLSFSFLFVFSCVVTAQSRRIVMRIF